MSCQLWQRVPAHSTERPPHGNDARAQPDLLVPLRLPACFVITGGRLPHAPGVSRAVHEAAAGGWQLLLAGWRLLLLLLLRSGSTGSMACSARVLLQFIQFIQFMHQAVERSNILCFCAHYAAEYED